ncbi:MAG: ABC transporter ATP-binding protein/permease, partial [Steroidobacteraceae bacterium]
MIERAEDSSDGHSPETEAAHSGLVPQLGMIVRAMLGSPAAKSLVALVAGTFAVIAATAYGQVWLNRWNQPFYDALTRRDFHDFLVQLGMFFFIVSFLLVLNVAQRWLVETLKVKMREGLVGDLIRDWMSPRRAFWLANAGPMGVNPDQRMHDDARHLCELSGDLGSGLIQASVTLVAFIGVLWVLSRGFVITLAGHDIPVPGYMVWAAIIYAAFGSLLSYWVGGSLIGRNAERYAREGDLRFALVRVNEHLDGITLAAGEEGERRRLESSLSAVLEATQRLVTGLTNLTWITAGFGWVLLVAPLLVAAPLYFGGTLSFGGLMQAAAAFTTAQASLRWFVDNFSNIADWRATLLRVANFRRAVVTTDVKHEVESHI